MSSTQGGATLQLAAYGAQDLYLTGNPQITNFKASIQRHTNFATESIQLYFTGDPHFGKKVYCPLLRIGDLINKIYLYMELPQLIINPPEGLLVSWVNAIGFMMIKSIEIQIGEHVVDKQYGQWMFIWSELTSDANKKDAFNSMIGYTPDCNLTPQNGPLKLYIPLYFWFCRDSGSSLPLIALQYQDVRIGLELRDFNQLWISNHYDQAKPLIGEKQPINAWLMVDYIFLDTEERRWFAQNKHYYLIQQLQSTTISIDVKKEVNIIELPFNHPVKELIWVYQGKSVQQANEWTNFSATLQEPLTNCNKLVNTQNSAIIKFEGTDRFEEQPSKFFTVFQPYNYHTAVPNESLFINVYSFALRPELLQPTGSANFSRLDSVTLHVNTKGSNQESDITVYAMNYNIFRIMGGLSGVLFTD